MAKRIVLRSSLRFKSKRDIAFVVFTSHHRFENNLFHVIWRRNRLVQMTKELLKGIERPIEVAYQYPNAALRERISKAVSRQNKRAKNLGIPGRLTTKHILKLHEVQNGTCYYCDGLLENTFHIDHMRPLSRGGTNHTQNVVLTCPSCNLEKHDKLPEHWRGLISGRA